MRTRLSLLSLEARWVADAAPVPELPGEELVQVASSDPVVDLADTTVEILPDGDLWYGVPDEPTPGDPAGEEVSEEDLTIITDTIATTPLEDILGGPIVLE